MNWAQIFTTSAVTALLVIVGLAGTAVYVVKSGVHRADWVGGMRHSASVEHRAGYQNAWFGRHRSDRSGHNRGGMQFLCGDDEKLDAIAEHVTETLDLSAEQISKLEAVKSAVLIAKAEAGEFCRSHSGDSYDSAGSLPERLEGIAQNLRLGAAFLGSVRPSLEDFYGDLTDPQKARLDGLTHHRRRHMGHS